MDGVVTANRRGEVVVARCHGELDLIVRDHLRGTLTALVRPGVHTLVVDLSDVTFIDCTGLGEIIAVARHCSHHGVRLLLSDVPLIGRHVLDALDLAGAFVTVPDAETAIALAESWAELASPLDPATDPFLSGPARSTSPRSDLLAP